MRRTMPMEFKLGRASASPIVKKTMPVTSPADATYSRKEYFRPSSSVPTWRWREVEGGGGRWRVRGGGIGDLGAGTGHQGAAAAALRNPNGTCSSWAERGNPEQAAGLLGQWVAAWAAASKVPLTWLADRHRGQQLR